MLSSNAWQSSIQQDMDWPGIPPTVFPSLLFADIR